MKIKGDSRKAVSALSGIVKDLGVVRVARDVDNFLVKQASRVMPEKCAKGIVRGGLPVLVAGGLVASAYSGPVTIAGVCIKSGSLCTTTLVSNATLFASKAKDVGEAAALAELGYQYYNNFEETPEPTPVV